MRKPAIARPTKTFERPLPWMILVALFVVLFGGCVGTCALGPFESVDTLRFGANLRGYTFGGLFMGFASVFFAFLAFWYSARKRRDVANSSMTSWLWSHVAFGLLALFAGAMHGGCGVASANVSTGKILFFFFLVITFTGVIWRIRYASVPKTAAAEVLNYSKEGALRRAEEQLLEIEKLVAGRSPDLQRIKNWLLSDTPAHAPPPAHGLSAEEHAILREITELVASRKRALARPGLQDAYTRAMHRWRRVHVPVAFLVVLFLFVHVVGAFDVPRKMLPLDAASSGPLAAFRSSSDCKECHGLIHQQWSDSMHAHALSSPLTIVQNNLDMKSILANQKSPDPRRMCINCHGPAVAAMVGGDTLPLRSERQDEGIECTACHQLQAEVPAGGGALVKVYSGSLSRGDTYYGNLTSPIGNAYHKSDKSPLWEDPSRLCATCHDVHLDKDRDGKITPGTDLVLQTTFEEWREYQAAGGKQTCVSCHMPSIGNQPSAAERARVPIEQDYNGAARRIHDHSFVGVDYPLDTVVTHDPQRAKRAALLAGAAVLELETSFLGDLLNARVALTNQTGHALPTGFAFARQMWIELTVKDAAGRIAFSSGLLANPHDDLCDAGTFGDTKNPLRKFVVGCNFVDLQLANFQLKLVDRISNVPSKDARGATYLTPAPDGEETYLQHLTAGGTPRTRPSDRSLLSPLRPGERRVLGYTVPLAGLRRGIVTARLHFRNLPPYWVRGMAAEQAPDEKPRLGPMVDNIQTVLMAEKTVVFSH